ncbi:hypothetical protein PFLUV_G00007730 [Perca fluviatilis]|uniref:DDE Tnp4 domain-containing protein n=1 Tax=Perca fluviatilis TaxID=8168 RepID=A0A6A5FJP1_PERFL|nr:hypothetical protein PFLUV_G00007730 [Perca fluviatilis]
MATPVICIINPEAPAHRQQAVLMATKEARCCREKKMVFPKPPQELLFQASALTHTEKLLRAEGIPAPSRQLCLEKLLVPFGQYDNAPFHWLVTNDVGYMKYQVVCPETNVPCSHGQVPAGQSSCAQNPICGPWVLPCTWTNRDRDFVPALGGQWYGWSTLNTTCGGSNLAIEKVRGPAGLDESGVSLFKTPEAIDEMWASQQRHLEFIQDPPGMIMYRLARTADINNVDVPFYECLGGRNSLEGFHKTLPHMIPGARVLCLEAEDGIDRPPQHPLSAAIRRDYGAPADVPSNELLGLEYLFGQSTGESGPFSLKDIVNDGPGPEEEVVQPRQPDPESDEAYQSDVEAHDDVLDVIMPHITLTSDETSTVHPPAFLERFCSVLVEIGLTEDKLSLSSEERNDVLDAWSKVDEHDKQPQQFNQLYRTHWGNTLYCRTKRDDLVDAASLAHIFISLPSLATEKCASSKEDFYKIAAFPNVIGALDCTQIRIKRPSGAHEGDFVNRKSFYSINVQMICDAACIITNVEAKWPGSVHDSRVFRSSTISQRLSQGEFSGVLLGDEGYVCETYLLTPLADPQSAAHNLAHVRTRARIEMAFGLLKSRFQCLHHLRVTPDRARDIIVACTVLHNIACLRKERGPAVAPGIEWDNAAIFPDGINGRLVRDQYINYFR